MSTESLWSIFINASLVNNFVLAYFLGICPFLGVSAKLSTATRMGGAVTFVMLVSSVCAFGIQALLVAIDAPYLKLISFIAVIASTVQLVEMFIKKVSPALFRALGIFLPLITVNCAVLGVSLFMVIRKYTFIQSVLFGAGSGIGWMLAILAMAGLRQRLNEKRLPEALHGPGIALIISGIMAMAFIGFSGMVQIQ